MEEFRQANNTKGILQRKARLKHKLFDVVADQTGKLFKDEVLTIVWARRFAEYKRPDLITRDYARFKRMMDNTETPVQIIFAGKPYPMDYGAINTFNSLAYLSRSFDNMAVLTGYELKLSRQLKEGSDVWLNNPRVPREASGTSGMTASMNASVNLSTDDGWIPEFVNHGNNGFVVPKADYANMTTHDQDEYDLNKAYEILEQQIIPLYYEDHDTWRQIMKNGMIELYFSAPAKFIYTLIQVDFRFLMDAFPEQQNKLTFIYREDRETQSFTKTQATHYFALKP